MRADQDQTLAKHFLTLATMSEKRSAYRRRLLKTGCIITGDKAPTIQCTVRNAADTGAALQVSTSFGIPGNFDVIIEGARRRCRVLWRTDTMIGVSFGAGEQIDSGLNRAAGCPLYPRKRTCAAHKPMSAKSQERTSPTELRQTERPPRGGPSKFDRCFDQAAACAFLFRRHPSRPKAPRPLANSGSAAGIGVADSASELL